MVNNYRMMTENFSCKSIVIGINDISEKTCQEKLEMMKFY